MNIALSLIKTQPAQIPNSPLVPMNYIHLNPDHRKDFRGEQYLPEIRDREAWRIFAFLFFLSWDSAFLTRIRAPWLTLLHMISGQLSRIFRRARALLRESVPASEVAKTTPRSLRAVVTK